MLGTSDLTADAIGWLVARTRELTDRPFGVNVIIADDSSDEDRAIVRGGIGAAIAERVAAVVLFWGDPAPYVPQAHAGGVKVFIQVGSIAEAQAAAAAGVDAVIAQGVEAGGHVRGTTSIWELLPAAVAAVAPVPVLASGGIGDGAGSRGRYGWGRKGSRWGRGLWLAARPSSTRPTNGGSLRAPLPTPSTTSCTTPGGPAPHRTLRNQSFLEWDVAGRPPPGERPGEGTAIGTRRLSSGEVQQWPRYAVGILPPNFEGDLESAPMLTGESCSVVNDLKPAAAIVRDLARDAEAALG